MKIIKVYHYPSAKELIFAVDTNKKESQIQKDWQKCIKEVQDEEYEPELDLVFKKFKKLGYVILSKDHINIEYGF